MSTLATPSRLIIKFALFALVLSSVVIPARAVEKIEGAFGLKLGDVWHPKEKPDMKYGGGEGYTFTPAQPNSAFSDYLVWITPESHRIFKIMAIGVAPDGKTAEARCAGIAAVLNEKYGGCGFAQRVTVEDRAVCTQLYPQQVRQASEPQPPIMYAVWYEDSILSAQAVTEKNAARLKELLRNADPTGL
jgi:hypothetical protein